MLPFEETKERNAVDHATNVSRLHVTTRPQVVHPSSSWLQSLCNMLWPATCLITLFFYLKSQASSKSKHSLSLWGDIRHCQWGTFPLFVHSLRAGLAFELGAPGVCNACDCCHGIPLLHFPSAPALSCHHTTPSSPLGSSHACSSFPSLRLDVTSRC